VAFYFLLFYLFLRANLPFNILVMVVSESTRKRLKTEYDNLIIDFGLKRVESLFSKGFESYIDSRIYGHYSLDATKQTLKL